MLNIGKLDRRISIERETETVKPSGSVAKAWATVATVWAEIVQQTASEFLTGFGEAENGTMIFRVRWIPGTHDRRPRHLCREGLRPEGNHRTRQA
ncbi:phage head closure protein [Sinorhizobium prairiense]|uniref:phage head closure protein n=1 Tax=Sinorhizobium sp. M103 TaxID=2976821 RepID=UPI0031F2DE0A